MGKVLTSGNASCHWSESWTNQNGLFVQDFPYSPSYSTVARTTNDLIMQCECAGWSSHLLIIYMIRLFPSSPMSFALQRKKTRKRPKYLRTCPPRPPSPSPTKTQIAWSEYPLSAWRNLASLAVQNAPSEDSDQTARMRRLIWIFAGRTCPKVPFVRLWRMSLCACCKQQNNVN